MAIVELQRRQTEVGRIRLGQKVQTKNGKTAPARLETFRFTSPSRPLIEKIAELYGGDVQPWSPPRGAGEWEVITKTTSVPVVVPPQDIDSSQFYELWSAGGCQRRCTGVRELIGDTPCVCDPDDRECKMHTRINVMLRDVPGIGVWRLDTGGYYAAVELPGMVQLLASSGGMVPALLELRQRTVTRDGQTKHFVVPVLHVEDFTPGQLVSGQVPVSIVGGQERQAIGAAPANGDAPQVTAEDLLKRVPLARNAAQLRGIWDDARDAKIKSKELQDAINARAEALKAAPKANGQVTAAAEPAVEGEIEPDADAVWAQINGHVGKNQRWNADELEQRVIAALGKPSADANGFELERFLGALKAGQVPA